MDGGTVSESEGLKTSYKSYTKRKVLFIVICLTVAISSVGISVSVGGRNVEFLDVYSTIYHHIIGTSLQQGTAEWMDDYIIWNVRLPRAVFAAIAGAGLAVGGAVMQSVMKNPLADPYTTGVSSGACFGVAVGMVLGFTAINQLDQFGLVLNAFLFALIPMVMIIMLSPLSNSSPATLILAGVAISYLFNALNTLLLVTTDAETLATVYRWQIGSLVNITWDSVPLMALITVSGIVVISFLSKRLNLMALGDAQAKSLGLDVNSLRTVCLVIMSLMAASVIAYAGIIGFVGLISPHIVRMIIDADNRFVVPAAAAFGAAFLMVSDIVSRLISDIGAIPVGVVISFVGAPIFLYLIIKQGRHIW
ncbi:MAG: iron ABC transporter permease [Candidatus Methanoplasma sp.]|jgi:iron complex transport system permease protein|nr:iron ABC transporter permease [Candidatus Methanoplasma sp.]